MFSTSAKNLKESIEDVTQMRATYSNMPKFAIFELVVPIQYLKTLYHIKNQHAKSAELSMETYEIATERGDYFVAIIALLEACNSYRQCDKPDKADICLKEAQSFFGAANKPYFELMLSRIKNRRGLTHI